MKSFLAALILMLLLVHANASARPIAIETFSVCPATGDQPPMRFDTPQCVQTPIWDLDPQGRDLWVHAQVSLPHSGPDQPPLGLYVSAKTSSEAYVNGVRIGANGVPAASKGGETPGQMDTVYAIPDGLLHEGNNDIVLRLSSFHGAIHLSRPVHWIAVAPYGDPVDMLLRAYWPSLVTFGVLLAGALFFASTAISSVNRRYPLLLSLLSLLAAAQLFAEVYRGLAHYSYPLHDLRLIAIAGFSAAFGVTMVALMVSRFVEQRRALTARQRFPYLWQPSPARQSPDVPRSKATGRA